jgi:hypothetical protein
MYSFKKTHKKSADLILSAPEVFDYLQSKQVKARTEARALTTYSWIANESVEVSGAMNKAKRLFSNMLLIVRITTRLYHIQKI